MLTALETLKAAEQRLANPDIPYQFTSGQVCTCGHIYAATGGEARAFGDVRGVYSEALQAVIDANAEIERTCDYEGDPNALAWIVSDLTWTASLAVVPEGTDPVQADALRREVGLGHVRNAIAMLEARYEADRLNVLQQTQQIIDNADTREPAHA